MLQVKFENRGFRGDHLNELNAMIDVNVNFQTVTATDCFFNLISLNTKVPLILHIKFQPNIQSHSGENVDFIGLLFLISTAILES